MGTNPDIAEAAAIYKNWAYLPIKERPINLDLRSYLSALSNGGTEYEKQTEEKSNSLAVMRATTVPAKKRKREVCLTDNSSEEEYHYNKGMYSRHMESYPTANPSVSADSHSHSQSNISSKETTSTMTTEPTPRPDFHSLKWLVKAIRGRKSLVSSSVDHGQLARLPVDQQEAKPSTHQGEFTVFTAKDHGVDKSELVKHEDAAKFEEQAIEAKPIDFFNGDQVVNMSSSDRYEHPGDGMLESYKHRICVMNLQQKKVISSGNRFKCNECDKSFPSHQALGGHKTSHNKRNTDGPRPQEKKQGPLVMRDHRCKICDKTFPTGQALGGHKRLHYAVPSKAPTSPTSILATSQGHAQSHKLFGVDLNQPAELEAGKESHLDLTI